MELTNETVFKAIAGEQGSVMIEPMAPGRDAVVANIVTGDAHRLSACGRLFAAKLLPGSAPSWTEVHV